jgi:integrase
LDDGISGIPRSGYAVLWGTHAGGTTENSFESSGLSGQVYNFLESWPEARRQRRPNVEDACDDIVLMQFRRWLKIPNRPLVRSCEHGCALDDGQPLFQNRHGTRLGRHGARYILLKHLRRAAISMPSLARPKISPHTLRHTKAMHLLQSGIPLVTVKDFLGHADLQSTEVYVQADLEMKVDALAKVGGPHSASTRRARLSQSLITWLESL